MATRIDVYNKSLIFTRLGGVTSNMKVKNVCAARIPLLGRRVGGGKKGKLQASGLANQEEFNRNWAIITEGSLL